VWWDDENIKENLASGQPEQLAEVISDLVVRMENVDELEVAPVTISILDCFGETVPEETQLNFFRLVTGYNRVSPPLS
jgi:hypothetical protein